MLLRLFGLIRYVDKFFFFFSSRRRHTRLQGDWSSDVCSSDLVTAPICVNDSPEAQPDANLRELNSQPSAPGPREEVYCTKIGATRPDEMYIIGAHMDGIGWGEAADDNASGTALVVELARVLNSADVRTERSIRFALWNNEETGLNGSRAYVAQRAALQGKEDPPGSGRYPEPRWLGMIQHDMVLFDHGMPRADGTLSPEQRPEADVNIEFQSASKFADQALKLAFFFRDANEKYATDYPAAVGHHMTNTDSTPFMDFAPAISVREHERGVRIAEGARHLARFIKAARAREREHDVHRAQGPVDCISAFQTVAGFCLRIRNDQFLRFKAVCDLDETRSTRVGGRFAEADLGALDLGDARPGHPAAPVRAAGAEIIDQALGDAERHARKHVRKKREHRHLEQHPGVDLAARRRPALGVGHRERAVLGDELLERFDVLAAGAAQPAGKPVVDDLVQIGRAHV